MVIVASLLCGCSDKPITMNGNMTGRLDGQVQTAIKLEGPVQMQVQLQGPTIHYEGTYISDELVEEVQTGKTTDDWVLAVFGEPTAKADLRDGTTIWRWTYKPTEQQASVVDLFSSDPKEPELAARTVFIQFRDSVAIRKWKG